MTNSVVPLVSECNVSYNCEYLLVGRKTARLALAWQCSKAHWATQVQSDAKELHVFQPLLVLIYPNDSERNTQE